MDLNLNTEQESPGVNQKEINQLRERIKQLEGTEASEQESVRDEEPIKEQSEIIQTEQDTPQMVAPVPTDDQVQQSGQTDDDQVTLPQVDDNLAAELKQLVQLALTQGLDQSINKAIKLKNPFVLDELHDTLVDHLYEQLIRMNKVSKDI